MKKQALHKEFVEALQCADVVAPRLRLDRVCKELVPKAGGQLRHLVRGEAVLVGKTTARRATHASRLLTPRCATSFACCGLPALSFVPSLWGPWVRFNPLFGKAPLPTTQARLTATVLYPLMRRKSSGMGEGPIGRRTRGAGSVSGAMPNTKPREGPSAWFLFVGTQRITGVNSHASPSAAMRRQM